MEEEIDWNQWIREHSAQLFLHARTQCRCEADAEEVLNDAIRQLVERVSSGNFHGDSSQWVNYTYTAIRHKAIDKGRREDTRKNYEGKAHEMGLLEDAQENPWFICASDDEYRREQIEQLLRRISPDFAEVITLKIWGERTFQDIADILKLPLATVSSRYRYGLKAMRGILEDGEIKIEA